MTDQAQKIEDTRVTHLPTEEYVWPTAGYEEMHKRSLADPEGFWAGQARTIDWFKEWDKVVDWKLPYARWFVGGKLNLSYQFLDRHMGTPRQNKVAFYWEGEFGETRTVTYSQLYTEVNRFASVLKNLGIGKGDKVTIYL